MRIRKKGYNNSRNNKVPESSLSLSVIVPVRDEPHQLSPFLESLAKIRKPFEKDYEVIFAASDPVKTSEILRKFPGSEGLLNKKIFKIIPVTAEMTDLEIFRTGFRSAGKRNVLIFEIAALNRAFNFDEIFSINQELIDKGKVILPLFRDQKIRKKYHHPLILLNGEFAGYLFSLAISPDNDFQDTLFYILTKLEIPYTETTISQICPIGEFKPVRKDLFRIFYSNLRLFIEWFIRLPLKEIRTRPHKHFSFITVPSYFRILFLATAVVIAILMPVIGFDTGFSGDEDKHYNHAGKVYNYYATNGEDKSALSDPEFKLNYYGQSFDLLTYLINKIFDVDKIYETRHIFIALTGFLVILFTSMLVCQLAGYRAALITMILMFFTPPFLGHSFNNSLDVPFALGYVFTIYQVFRFLKKLPKFSVPIAIWITLGIAWTISIRIGGLMLVPYIFFFAGLYLLIGKWQFRILSGEGYRFIRKGLIFLIIISFTAYSLSLLPWPYGLQHPFKNPFEALKIMSNISVAIRVLFNGEIYWSNALPWYYISMNIIYTVPVIILLGFITNLLLYRSYHLRIKTVFIFFLYFAVIFPLVYVVYKESNVYGGWRHLLFVFPPLVAISGITFDSIMRYFRSKYVKLALWLILLLGILHPLRHMVVNHPFEYIYFNELLGSVKKAYGRFENDYYLNSLKQGSDWLIDNVLTGKSGEEGKIIITSNGSIEYYFRHHKDKVSTTYSRYYDRGSYNWDYAVFFCNYIDPYQLKNNIWPPYKTIHTIDVDHVPICAVVRRESKRDYEAIQLLNQKDYLNGIPMLEEVIQKEPYNEIAMLRLAEAYIQNHQFDKAHEAVDQCLNIYPDYDKALVLKGVAYMQNQEYNEAVSTFVYIINKVNYRFVTAYHNLALIYLRQNDPETAKNYLRKAIEVNSTYKPAYLLMADILNSQGRTNEANQYLKAANEMN